MKKNSDRAIVRLVIATGISSVVTQLLTIRELLIERRGYFIPTLNLAGNQCKFCNTSIPGVWHEG